MKPDLSSKKILIFSDTHFWPDKFDWLRFYRLKKLIQQADRVIINGDFWEGYAASFDEFLVSPWRHLFPVLKQKNTVYIYGNHDKAEYSDSRIFQFCDVATDVYTFTSSGKKFVVLHGDQVNPSADEVAPFVRRRFFVWLNHWFYLIGNALFKTQFWTIFHRQNIKLQLLQQTHYPDAILIAGHTHLPMQTDTYVNTGQFNYAYEQHLWVEEGKVWGGQFGLNPD